MTVSKKCFVIAPIGDEDSSTRVRSDKVLKYFIKPVVESLGYDNPVRADHLSQPGVITAQVIQRINDDDLVIADLTESNPNVFYELAIRHMIRKPLVQIIERNHKLPFDVAGSRTIHFDHTDIESVERAKLELKEQIISVESSPSEVDNPITLSLDLKALKASGNPSEKILGLLQEKLSSIESAMGNIDGWSSIDDLDSKLDDIERKLEGLDGLNSRLDDIESKVESLATES